MLLKKYKNKLYHLINEEGWNPNEFNTDLLNINNNLVFRLKYKDQPMYFDIRTSPDSFHKFQVRYSTFERNYPISDWQPNGSWESFDNSTILMKKWLSKDLKEYIEENKGDDLWQIAANSSKSLKLEYINFDDNSPFTLEEKAQVKLGLEEVKILLFQNFKFDENQKKLITLRIAYLDSAVERNTKTDWKGITISTIIGLILNLAVDTSVGKAIWDLFSRVFENLPRLPMPF